MKYEYSSHMNRKFSPTNSTLVIKPNNVNVNDLIDSETGIFEIRKDMDITNWMSLRNRSSSIMCSSHGDNSLKENVGLIGFEMNIVELDD